MAAPFLGTKARIIIDGQEIECDGFNVEYDDPIEVTGAGDSTRRYVQGNRQPRVRLDNARVIGPAKDADRTKVMAVFDAGAAAFNAVGGLDKFDMAALPLPIFPADWQVKQLPTTAAAANALARAASLPARVVKPEPEKPNHFTQPTKRVIVIADLEDG